MMTKKDYATSRNLPKTLVRRLIIDKVIPSVKLYSRWYVDEERADDALRAICCNCYVGRRNGKIATIKEKIFEEIRRANK